MKSCVTISLVDQARGGPFVFWDDLASSCARAAALGFDAVELFAPGPDAVDPKVLAALLSDHGLALAAVGTGAGWVIHRLSLTAADAKERAAAVDFVRSMIDFGGPFGASAIIGSMQGRWTADVGETTARSWLRDALGRLSEHAASHDLRLIYEPLNRYETNLCNTLADGVRLLEGLPEGRVGLLADLFHMNIEEASLADALTDAGRHVAHVHFVDSNRQPVGAGHLDVTSAVQALRSMGYRGYLSAEALPVPDSDAAARMTIEAFRRLVTA